MNVVICFHFGNSQPSVSLKISSFASLIKEISPITQENLLKKDFCEKEVTCESTQKHCEMSNKAL